MRPIVLLLVLVCLLGMPLAGSLTATPLRFQVTPKQQPAPSGSDVIVFPASDDRAAHSDAGADPNAELLKKEFETAVNKNRVVRGKVDGDSNLAVSGSCPENSGPLRFLVSDSGLSNSMYTGIGRVSDSSVQLRRVTDPATAKAFEGIFNDKRLASQEADLTALQEESPPAPQLTLDVKPPSEKDGLSRQPTVPASATPKTSSADATTHASPSWGEKADLAPDRLRARNPAGDLLANLLFFICLLVAVFSSPIMFFLAYRQHRQLTGRIGLLQEEVQKLHRKIDDLRKPGPAPVQPGPGMQRFPAGVSPMERAGNRKMKQESRPSAPEPKPPPAARSEPVPPATLEACFVEWCTMKNNGHIDNPKGFANFLGPRLGEVQVRVLYRDRNAGMDSVTFNGDVGGAKDPMEYWSVQIRGAENLLPKPDIGDFCELSPAFESEGPVTPQTLREIVPGRLMQIGDGAFQLQKPGRIS